jgi:hypothetical protein
MNPPCLCTSNDPLVASWKGGFAHELYICSTGYFVELDKSEPVSDVQATEVGNWIDSHVGIRSWPPELNDAGKTRTERVKLNRFNR